MGPENKLFWIVKTVVTCAHVTVSSSGGFLLNKLRSSFIHFHELSDSSED